MPDNADAHAPEVPPILNPAAPTPLEILASDLQHAIEESPDAKIVCDVNGLIVVFNKRAESMFHYSRAEVLGKSINTLLPAPARDKHQKLFEGFVDEPGVREMGAGRRLVARRRDGKEFLVQISLTHWTISGIGFRAMAVVRRAAPGAGARLPEVPK